MAEKKAMVTYDSVMRELKAGKYRPVYLLMGDESYFIDKIADFITDNVLTPEEDSELPGFVEGYLKLHKTAIDPKAAAMVAEHVGSDLNRLVSELDKVLISLPEDNRVVTPEIVEHQIGVSKDFNAFELNRAIVEKNVFKANQIVNYFDKNPKAGSIYSFLPLIFSFFQKLMVAYYAPDRRSEVSVAQHLELKSTWLARDYMTGMRNYSATKTLQIISKIREIDAKSKGLDNPNTPPGELMKELLFFILH